MNDATTPTADKSPSDSNKLREAIVFSALACLFSWLWWGALFLRGIGPVSELSDMDAGGSQLARMLIVIGNFGPMVAALVMRLFVSREGLKGSIGWRRSWRHYLSALLGPMLFFGVLAMFNHFTGLAGIEWTRTDTGFGAYVGIELPIGALIISVFVFGEEYGWRGYLLPRLLAFGEVRGSVMVGLVWALWHLPLLLAGVNYPGQNPLVFIPLFALVVVCLSFPFTWLYNASAGSVAVAALLHGSVNAYGDGLLGPAVAPGGNPLVTGSGGVVTAAALLCVVISAYRARLFIRRLQSRRTGSR